MVPARPLSTGSGVGRFLCFGDKMSWVRLYPEMLYDPSVQLLTPGRFRRKFMAAIEGEKNEFSRHIKAGRGRGGTEWAKVRTEVFERDDYTCSYCGSRGEKLECDHIVPMSRGGDDGLENLTTACFPCNRSKRDKALEEWLV